MGSDAKLKKETGKDSQDEDEEDMEVEENGSSSNNLLVDDVKPSTPQKRKIEEGVAASPVKKGKLQVIVKICIVF